MTVEKYYFKAADKVKLIILIAGILGIVISAAGYLQDKQQFFASWLVAFTYWTSIALGGLFLTLLHHLTGSTWSVVLRRFFETTAKMLPLLFLFFVPVILGIHELYHWSHKEIVASDPALLRKAGYLNPAAFSVRTLLYFVIWSVLGYFLYKKSIAQDNGAMTTDSMRKLSAPGIVLFAFTISFAAFDWIMALDAHWYSTIFGVYYFSGSTLGVLAFITLLVLILRSKGILKNEITIEHYHDLGKLLFTFTVFWSYIAFSQYFLIWYANIPEETIWFQHRWVGSWKLASMFLVIGHFVIPFFALMIRASKRNMNFLMIISIWLLLIHWFDLYWLIMPSFHHENAVISWMDAATLVGIGGIFVWYFLQVLQKNSIIPVNDPKLEASIHFKNNF